MKNTKFRSRAALAGLALLSALLLSPVPALAWFTAFTVSQGEYPDKVHLTWSESAGSSGDGTFTVCREDLRNPGMHDLAETTDTEFDDTTAEPGIAYRYGVVTYGGDSRMCTWDNLDFQYASGWAGTLPVPVDLAASKGTYADKVRITWGVPAGAPTNGLYEVLRQAVGADGGFHHLSPKTTNTYFDDTNAVPGVAYRYMIWTFAPDIAESEEVTGWAGTPPPLQTVTNLSATQGEYPDRVRLTWHLPENASTFGLLRYHYVGSETIREEIADGIEGSVFVDRTVEPGVHYNYAILVTDVYGRTSQSPYTADGWSFAIPGVNHFTASRGEYDDRVWLDWKPEDPSSIVSYDILRFIDMGGAVGYEVLTNGLTSPGYLDTTVTPDVCYRYQLRIHDTWGRTGVSEFVPGWAFSRPDNDDFKNARPISSKSGSDFSTNNCATFEVSEPYPAGVTTASKTVWWDYAAPLDGIVQFNTVGSSYLAHWGDEDEWPDELAICTAYGVYTGKAVTVLDEVCSATPHSDDEWGYTWCSNAFEAAAGTVYHIQVSGLGNTFYDDTLDLWDEQWGRVCLNWSYTHVRVGLDPNGGKISTNAVMVPVGQTLGEALQSFPEPKRDGVRFAGWTFENGAPAADSADLAVTENFTLYAEWGKDAPDNDDFEDAWAISGKSGSSVSVNDYATFQADESFPSGVGTEIWWDITATNTLWWNFTAPCDGMVQFTTDGSHDSHDLSIRTAMAVWTGDALGSLRELCHAYADRDHERSAGWCTNTFEVSAGTVYRIQAFSSQMDDGGMGKGTICLNWAYTHLRLELDPNGGTISTNAVMVPVGQKLGDAMQSFPMPEREGYR
ncbi:MAG: InlB B-repeat-containing protein, partial [Kiritimatiellae bacterium]|nr:InlB B-repeat-containing protein [Kiritimatiellia bacterium]